MYQIFHLGYAAASPPSPQDWLGMAVFAGPLCTVTAEGLVNREHTPNACQIILHRCTHPDDEETPLSFAQDL